MASIYFTGTYPPTMCGIADYTSFITRESPDGKWGVITFDPSKYGAPQVGNGIRATDRVWYGIPDCNKFSASVIQEGIRHLNVKGEEAILWFQHEMAIWADNQAFIEMLRQLSIPTIVTFHTLHFQSNETPSGLQRSQYNLLRGLLPYVEAITVFSHGVYYAVTTAFPEYREKVYVMKHGVHSYPEVVRLSRKEAKEKFNDFLMYDSSLPQRIKDTLHKQRVFLDEDAVVIGETGFLCPMKQSESLYFFRDNLRKLIPHRRILAVRIGSPRDNMQKAYSTQLRREQTGKDKFLLETWLPAHMLPVVQKAFDVNLYWPSACTQSGVVAHALGAGAIVAGRDLEGTGETLNEAGEPVDTDIRHLLLKVRDLILNPERGEKIEETVLRYAARFSWENQAWRHYDLADRILHPTSLWSAPYSSLSIDGMITPTSNRTSVSSDTSP